MKRQPRSARAPKPKRTVSIIGTGSYVPEKILTNDDLEEWSRPATNGSSPAPASRNAASPPRDEHTSDMAAKAALKAIEQAGISADEIDLILVATVTPDMFFPGTACFVQKKIGAKNAACFDVSAACSGFLYAIEIAQQFITSHTYDTVLVIGADKLTSIIDWTDRNTCVLFGDGAGAAILRHRGGAHGVISTYMASDGGFTDILYMPGGGSRCPDHEGERRSQPQHHQDERQGDLQAGRHLDARRRAKGARRRRPRRPKTSPASSRTRPICASSRPSPIA